MSKPRGLKWHEDRNKCIFCKAKFPSWEKLVDHYKEKKHMPYRNHDEIHGIGMDAT